MADFSKYAPKLLQLEGGYSNDKDDKGGITVKGITLTTYRAYCGANKTAKDLQNISYGTWQNIMKDGYWDKCRADEIDNQSLAEIIADWCVNSGTTGIKKAQNVIGVKPDGIVGPITLSMINNSNPETLHDRILKARKHHYDDIVEKDPTQKKFYNGWMNRLKMFKFE